MPPPAPARLSITTGCPSASVSLGAMARATKSAPPPAGNVTTTLIGLLGYACPSAGVADKNPMLIRAAANHAVASPLFMLSLLVRIKTFQCEHGSLLGGPFDIAGQPLRHGDRVRCGFVQQCALRIVELQSGMLDRGFDLAANIGIDVRHRNVFRFIGDRGRRGVPVQRR